LSKDEGNKIVKDFKSIIADSKIVWKWWYILV
jgi:hypothetical protein